MADDRTGRGSLPAKVLTAIFRTMAVLVSVGCSAVIFLIGLFFTLWLAGLAYMHYGPKSGYWD